MTELLNLSLRETIFRRIADSDGCYIMIYSGSGERLSFISSLFRGKEDDSIFRLLIDFSQRRYANMLACRRCIFIDSFSKKDADESPESFCLNIIRQKLREFAVNRAGSSRIIIVVDCSPFLSDAQEPTTNGVVAFHKDVVNLTNSVEGGTGVLLYDINTLSDRLIPELLEIHGVHKEALERPRLQALRQDLQERSKTTTGTAEVVVRDEGVLFVDPGTQSAALLVPLSDNIRAILPGDPLNVADRDIAFANNYTAYEGACPYLSEDVQSQCLLDPDVVRAVKTKGRAFVQGRPCVTAIDHMVLEAEPKKEVNSRHVAEADEAEDADSGKTFKNRYGTDTYPTYLGGSSIIRKHLNGRLKDSRRP